MMIRIGIYPSSTMASSATSRYTATLALSNDIAHGTCMPCGEDGGVEVALRRSVRDVDENRRRTWMHNLRFRSTSRTWCATQSSKRPEEMPTECSFTSHSPSGKRSLRVIKVKKGESAITCLEVWEGCELLSRSSAEGVHEGVSGQSTGLGGLSWGGDETFVVYVAERVKPPSASFFKTPPSTAAAAATAGAAGVAVGTDFDLRDDWGEKLVGSDRFALFKFDFAAGLIAHVPGSDGGGSDNGGCLTPAQPVVITAPQDGSSSVVFVAYPHSPKKLGLVYCYQRPCHLRRIPLPPPPPLTPLEAVEDTTGAAAASSDTSIAATATPSTVPFQVLTKGESVAFSPRLSQSGDCLAYLGSSDGFDTHQGSLELKLLDLKALEPLHHSLSAATATSTDEDGGGGVAAAAAVPVLASRRVLVPSSSSGDAAAAASTVTLDPTCPGGFSFPGQWWPSELPEKCWGADDATVWFTSLWGSRPCAFAADVASGELTRIPYGGTVPTGACGEQQEQGVGGSSGCAVKVLAACTSLGGALVAWSSPVHPGGVAFVLPKDKESAAAAGGWVWVEAPALGRQAITSTPTIGSGFSAAATAIEAARWFSTATPNPAPSLLAGNNGASGGGEGGDANGGSWRILSVVPPDSKSGVPIEAILVIPPPPLQSPLQTATATAETVTTSAGGQGLIVVPHGGPHSTTPTSFVATYNFLAAETNCAVLHVNYRGSLGFGDADLNSLPGNIGTQDVADVVLATHTALALTTSSSEKRPLFDASRVAVVGGSHGGFLAAHLIGQHPDIFKVAALRNPVTNIPSMVGVTDIPDWCHVESLGVGAYDFNAFSPANAMALTKMFECSPVAHIAKVRAPTLLCLGEKDRRVPCSQGVEFYHALKSRGVKARTLMYPEDSHPIDKPVSEADHWINVAAWINEHLVAPSSSSSPTTP